MYASLGLDKYSDWVKRRLAALGGGPGEGSARDDVGRVERRARCECAKTCVLGPSLWCLPSMDDLQIRTIADDEDVRVFAVYVRPVADGALDGPPDMPRVGGGGELG